MSRRLSALVAVSAITATAAGLGAVAVAPAAFAAGCLNGIDVSVNAPAEDVGSVVDAGAVTLSYASTLDTGARVLGDSGYLHVAASDLGGTDETGARFGASVALGLDASDQCSLVAVGAPGAAAGAGKVYLFKVSDTGLLPVAVLSEGSDGIEGAAEDGDHFGASVSFNGLRQDFAADWLAVGAPGQDLGANADAGQVYVIPTDVLGDGDVVLQQGKGSVPGTAEAGDAFGAALSFDGKGFSLAVGAPGEDVGTLSNAGAVTLMPGTQKRPPGSTTGRTLTQDSTGVPGTAEKGDTFGSALTAVFVPDSTRYQLAIGAPGEDIGTAKDAGVVTMTYKSGSYVTLQQGAGGASGAAETGDRFGAALAGSGYVLAVGVPGEDIGTAADAGMGHVFVLFPASDTKPAVLVPTLTTNLSQNSSGITDVAEAGDRFGSSAAIGFSGLVFGVPGEDAAQVDEGAVNTVPYDSTGEDLLTTTGQQFLTQSSSGFPDESEVGDALGSGAAALN